VRLADSPAVGLRSPAYVMAPWCIAQMTPIHVGLVADPAKPTKSRAGWGASTRLTPGLRRLGHRGGDNAAMESFFSLLQNNVLNERRWDTREELRLARRDLDRADLPPSTPPTTPRQTDPFEFEINTQTATLAA
jgi:hypothetical protein